MAKFVQFSWNLFLSIHVIQFLVVRADLCPIQMTPPRYHVGYDKTPFASRILSFVPHFYADLRFGRNAPHRKECDNVTMKLYGEASTKFKNVQLALQNACNTSWMAMFHALLPMNQDCPGAPNDLAGKK